ncbi:molybdopterin cofactor-binding domain-containing protein [Ramlibacter sp. MAHUQ-53]|uniref:xanthine dehydrogenase family protein molybdopterin-binding subunit n=1 Tax=unclassified Ramlibacter TaxID=2617605 RepID=UPI003640DCD6
MNAPEKFQISRRGLLQAAGAALVVGFSAEASLAATAAPALPPAKAVAKDLVDSFLVLHSDGKVTVYVGKVDLGTGTKTAMAQIAAEELEVPFNAITMVMGDTATTPDQWLTGANLTIAQGGGELRRACATARAALVARAAQRLGVPAADLVASGGVVRAKADASKSVTYAQLLQGGAFDLKVDAKATLKPVSEYKVVGTSVPRVDIPEKVTGEFIYAHDFRMPGMLHARVIRPDDLGASLESVDDSAARKVNGYVQTVRKGNFLAVVSRTEWGAVKAARAVKAKWSAGTGLPDQATVFDYWRKQPLAKEEMTQKVGDAPAALATAARRVKASYEFAVQTHASIGPSCAVADYKNGKLVVWSPSQATHSLQTELAGITGVKAEDIRVLYLDGSGCYGRNGHEDASADAALISVLIGKPVRVQWMRADETARAPKSPPRAIDMEGGFDASGKLVAWSADFHIALNHIVAFKPLDFPLLAATDLGQPKPGNWVGFLFQNSAAPYALPNLRVNTRHIEKAFFRSAHLRSPGRIENSFANESFMDELAAEAKVDPAEFRLQHLSDPRAIAVMRAAMKRAGWQARVGIHPDALKSTISRGRGISYVRYNNATTYVAAIAEVEVNRDTGEVRVTRVCVGHDCGQIVNPDGLANQIEGGVIQTVSRTLMEQVNWDRTKVTSVDWATYPILRFPDAPRVEVDMINVPGEVSWGAGEPTPTAIPAAIANAIYDATGARLRSIPITPEKVKAAIQARRA